MIVHKIWIVNSLLSVVVVATCAAGDRTLSMAALKPLAKAMLDNSIHGLIGLFSAMIVLTSQIDKLHLAVACMLMSCAIDADHFVAARSFKLADATSLQSRPFLHNSTILLVLIGLLAYLHYSSHGQPVIVWLIMAIVAFVTHHLRDANRRGLWFASLGNTPALCEPIYIALTVATPYLMKFFVPESFKYSRLSSSVLHV